MHDNNMITFSLDQVVHMMRMSGSGTFSSGQMGNMMQHMSGPGQQHGGQLGMMGDRVALPWPGSSQSQAINQSDAVPLGMGMGPLTTPEQDFKVINNKAYNRQR